MGLIKAIWLFLERNLIGKGPLLKDVRGKCDFGPVFPCSGICMVLQ